MKGGIGIGNVMLSTSFQRSTGLTAQNLMMIGGSGKKFVMLSTSFQGLTGLTAQRTMKMGGSGIVMLSASFQRSTSLTASKEPIENCPQHIYHLPSSAVSLCCFKPIHFSKNAGAWSVAFVVPPLAFFNRFIVPNAEPL